jgi:Lon protease-like protein
MFELPLFPLNTVLFPGMPLTLHIFEDRYKRMIRTCLKTRQPFGVVLVRHGQEAFGPLVARRAFSRLNLWKMGG